MIVFGVGLEFKLVLNLFVRPWVVFGVEIEIGVRLGLRLGLGLWLNLG